MRNLSKAVVGVVISLWCVLAFSQHSRLLEEQERMLDTMREHCNGLHYKRRNAERSYSWRELVNTSKSYADACNGVEDRFLIAKAYEDMSYGLLMLSDPGQAMRWVQSCLDQNPMAVGCAARKAEILWMTGKQWEARATISRGLMAGERAIGMTKSEMERVRMNKPDPRADTVYRTRYLRRMDMLDMRLSVLEDGLRRIKDMQDELDSFHVN